MPPVCPAYPREVSGMSTRLLKVGFSAISALLAGSGLGKAEEVTLNLALSSQSGGLTPVVALATRMGGDPSVTDDEAPSRYELEAPGRLNLDLPPGLWKLEFTAERYWSADVLFYLKENEHKELAGLLIQTGKVVGELEIPSNQQPPASLEVRARSAGLSKKGALPEPIDFKCVLGEGTPTFQCQVPADILDLRLMSPGFASFVAWSVEVVPSVSKDLGRIRVVPGASLTGWVAMDDGSPLIGAEEVEVEPTWAARAPELQRNTQSQSVVRTTVSPNEHGFFQMTGLSSGQYRVLARAPGRAAATIEGITIDQGLETELAGPLILYSPATLRIRLNPPQDPREKPWTLELLPWWSQTAKAILGEVQDGAWETTNLTPGDYRVTIRDSSRNSWVSEQTVVLPGVQELAIELPFVRLTGSVLLGDKPLRALLAFGGKRRGTELSTRSNSDGEFEITLPERKSWRVSVRSEEPQIDRELSGIVPTSKTQGEAYVEIVLPDTTILGEVIDEQGVGIPEARVEAINLHTMEVLDLACDGSGVFEAVGLDPSPLRLVARDAGDPSKVSGEVAVLPIEDDAVEVRLVVQSTTNLIGSVRASGEIVPGAMLLAIARSATHGWQLTSVPQAVSDVSGRFTLRIPADVDAVDLLVMAPGYALETYRVFLPVKEEIVVETDVYGGTLVVSGPSVSAMGPDAGSMAVLLKDGVPLDINLLAQWSFMNHTPAPSSGTITVPNMGAGSYQPAWSPCPECQRSQLRGERSMAYGARPTTSIRSRPSCSTSQNRSGVGHPVFSHRAVEKRRGSSYSDSRAPS